MAPSNKASVVIVGRGSTNFRNTELDGQIWAYGSTSNTFENVSIEDSRFAIRVGRATRSCHLYDSILNAPVAIGSKHRETDADVRLRRCQIAGKLKEANSPVQLDVDEATQNSAANING